MSDSEGGGGGAAAGDGWDWEAPSPPSSPLIHADLAQRKAKEVQAHEAVVRLAAGGFEFSADGVCTTVPLCSVCEKEDAKLFRSDCRLVCCSCFTALQHRNPGHTAAPLFESDGLHPGTKERSVFNTAGQSGATPLIKVCTEGK